MNLFYQKALFHARMLSLDVALGALASGSMVVALLEVEMPGWWWCVLPLSVWVIYTADHLMDAWRLQSSAHTSRHLYHYQYMKPIGFVWTFLLLFCLVWVPWHLPYNMVVFGLAMGGIVLIHLLLVRIIGDRISWIFHKELGVAVVYAVGVWGGPFSMAGFQVEGIYYGMFFQFFLLALFNLLLFSMYEMKTDELDGHTSFVRAIGVKNAQGLLLVLALLIGGIGIGLALQEGVGVNILAVEGIYLLMLSILMGTVCFPKYFGVAERYRAWADGVFLIPLLFPLIVWA